MALSKLDSLYMAVVADHSKHPHHQGQIEDCLLVWNLMRMTGWKILPL